MSQRFEIPALCSNCGTLFNSFMSIFGSDENGNFVQHLEEIRGQVPCQQCRYEADLRLDILKFAEQSFELLKTLDVEKLMILQRRIKTDHRRSVDEHEFKALASDITEEVPELKSFSDLMPRTRSEAYSVIAILLTLVGIAIQIAVSGPSPSNQTKNVIQTVTNTTIHNHPKKSSPGQKIKPNEPGPCGSGLKYKRCHGRR